MSIYKLTQKLIKQGFWYSRLCAIFKKFARSHALNMNIVYTETH